MSWNMRHPVPERVDASATPWTEMRNVILAFLRHRLTNYDRALSLLIERDPDAREGLRQAISEVAWKTYPWFKEDPRPFPEETDPTLNTRFLDEFALDAAHWQTVCEHLRSAIDDLKHKDPSRAQELRRDLVLATQERDAAVEALRRPTVTTFKERSVDGAGGTCQSFSCSNLVRGVSHGYFFLTPNPLPPNYYQPEPFSCPLCSARVMVTKRPMPIGQGHKVFIHSCHCTTTMVYPPPPRCRMRPLTAEKWGAAAGRAQARAREDEQ